MELWVVMTACQQRLQSYPYTGNVLFQGLLHPSMSCACLARRPLYHDGKRYACNRECLSASWYKSWLHAVVPRGLVVHPASGLTRSLQPVAFLSIKDAPQGRCQPSNTLGKTSQQQQCR